MIGWIENLQSNIREIRVPSSRKTDGSGYLQIERSESGITAGAVSRADEVSVFVSLSTATYLFAGEIVHRDSVGVEQAIRPVR